MHCIKCGRQIPENTVFCATCSAPPAPVSAAQLPPKTARSVKAGPVKKKKPRKKQNYRRIIRDLAISTAVLSLLLIAVSVFVFWQAKEHRQRLEDLRIREAGVTLRENEADKRDLRIRELETQLILATDELQAARDALEREQAAVEQLQQILGMTAAPTVP